MSKCFECGKPADANHHVVPSKIGGTRTVPLCHRHHMAVHGKGQPLALGNTRKWVCPVDEFPRPYVPPPKIYFVPVPVAPELVPVVLRVNKPKPPLHRWSNRPVSDLLK